MHLAGCLPLSGGIGFRQTSFYIDLAYTRMTNPLKYYMYNHQNVDPVTIETTRNTVIATLGLRF